MMLSTCILCGCVCLCEYAACVPMWMSYKFVLDSIVGDVEKGPTVSII